MASSGAVATTEDDKSLPAQLSYNSLSRGASRRTAAGAVPGVAMAREGFFWDGFFARRGVFGPVVPLWCSGAYCGGSREMGAFLG